MSTMGCHTFMIDEGILEEKLGGQHFSDTIRGGGGHICYAKVERRVI